MKTVFLILLLPSVVFGEALVDGVPSFDVPVSSMGETGPSNFEISIATSGIRFRNYTDFRKSVNGREHLRDKLDDMNASDRRKNARTINYIEAVNQRR